ncbi:MAG: YchJ family metal-binding protein, partial [Synechococcus sp.]|nr:YchJ family metal-binding protein [Synechococcus sp.]
GGFASSADAGPCPCGGERYESCCGPLHRGQAKAITAEQLMRSRYSAFVRCEVDYLMATHPEPDVPVQQRRHSLRQSCRQTKWLGLSVLQVTGGGPKNLEGTVQFEARYRGGVLKETSLFQRRGSSPTGDWLYIRAFELDG